VVDGGAAVVVVEEDEIRIDQYHHLVEEVAIIVKISIVNVTTS